MEKIKFAVQVFLLVLAFPVLFIAGTANDTKAGDSKHIHDVPTAVKTIEKHKCICRTECNQYKVKLAPVSFKN